jgi:hypothetical protein
MRLWLDIAVPEAADYFGLKIKVEKIEMNDE